MKRLLLLIPVIVIIGCGLFGGEDFFPLKVDNQWKYEGYIYSATDSATVKTETKITGEDQINSKDVFVLVTKMSMYVFSPVVDTIEVTDTSYVMETKDTIWTYSSKTDSTPVITAVLPLELDKTWQQIFGTDTINYIVKVKEDVTVPAETYKNSWKIEVKANNVHESYTWYADGTGNVKQLSEVGTDKFLLELTEATIK